MTDSSIKIPRCFDEAKRITDFMQTEIFRSLSDEKRAEYFMRVDDLLFEQSQFLDQLKGMTNDRTKH